MNRINKPLLLLFFSFAAALYGAAIPFTRSPTLDRLLNDMRFYKDKTPVTLHQGDLYEHSLWVHYAALDLWGHGAPYTTGIAFSERERDLFALAALLHDVGKAGRNDLFARAHQRLSYTLRHEGESLVAIDYLPDCQEHVVVGFEYLAAPFLDASSLPYISRLYSLTDTTLMNFKDLFDEVGVTPEERKLVAILAGMHWEFGKLRQRHVSNEKFIATIKALKDASHYEGPLDKKLVVLSVLIQVADVKGIAYCSPQTSWLFPASPDAVAPRVIESEPPFILFGYEVPGAGSLPSSRTIFADLFKWEAPAAGSLPLAHTVFAELMVYCDAVGIK